MKVNKNKGPGSINNNCSKHNNKYPTPPSFLLADITRDFNKIQNITTLAYTTTKRDYFSCKITNLMESSNIIISAGAAWRVRAGVSRLAPRAGSLLFRHIGNYPSWVPDAGRNIWPSLASHCTYTDRWNAIQESTAPQGKCVLQTHSGKVVDGENWVRMSTCLVWLPEVGVIFG